MELSRTSFLGTGKVIRFTFNRILKGKANIIISAILLIVVLISVPLISLLVGDSSSDVIAPEDIHVSSVWVKNQTDYTLLFDFEPDSPWFDVDFLTADFDTDDYAQRIKSDEAFVDIFFDSTKSAYSIKIYSLPETMFSPIALSSLKNIMERKLTESRLQSHDVSEEQMSVALSGYYTNSMTEDTYFDSDIGRDVELRFIIQYIYSILILMLGLFSLSYIIRTVIEEKGSNLVELLLVSVKPLSIVAGKIIAVMIYILALFVALAAAFGVSWFATSFFLNTSAVSALLAKSGIPSTMSLGPDSVFVLLISLLLGYLMIAILGGISGSCCSSMEDMESAQLSVVFIILAGYIFASFAPIFDSSFASIVFVLIPVVSIFTTPVSYLFGDIGSGVLLLSWAVQSLLIIYLSHFCSRVYSALVIHKGSRIRLKELVALSKRS